MKKEEALEQIVYMKELLSSVRLRAAEGYPYLILWGAVWFCGYIGSIWFDHTIWLFLVLVGSICSGIIGAKWNWTRNSNSNLLKKLGIQFFILFITFALFFALLLNAEVHWVINAFWPFAMGITYAIVGVFMGVDLMILGGGMALTSIISIFIPGYYQNIWLAFVGGIGLILMGFIFRKQVKQSE